jgi:hypothetical protein
MLYRFGIRDEKFRHLASPWSVGRSIRLAVIVVALHYYSLLTAAIYWRPHVHNQEWNWRVPQIAG